MIKFAITGLKIYVYPFQKKKKLLCSFQLERVIGLAGLELHQCKRLEDGPLAVPFSPDFREPLTLRSQHRIHT